MAHSIKSNPPKLLTHLMRLGKTLDGLLQILLRPTVSEVHHSNHRQHGSKIKFVTPRQKSARRFHQLQVNHDSTRLKHPEEFPERRQKDFSLMKIPDNEGGTQS